MHSCVSNAGFNRNSSKKARFKEKPSFLQHLKKTEVRPIYIGSYPISQCARDHFTVVCSVKLGDRMIKKNLKVISVIAKYRDLSVSTTDKSQCLPLPNHYILFNLVQQLLIIHCQDTKTFKESLATQPTHRNNETVEHVSPLTGLVI